MIVVKINVICSLTVLLTLISLGINEDNKTNLKLFFSTNLSNKRNKILDFHKKYFRNIGKLHKRATFEKDNETDFDYTDEYKDMYGNISDPEFTKFKIVESTGIPEYEEYREVNENPEEFHPFLLQGNNSNATQTATVKSGIQANKTNVTLSNQTKVSVGVEIDYDEKDTDYYIRNLFTTECLTTLTIPQAIAITIFLIIFLVSIHTPQFLYGFLYKEPEQECIPDVTVIAEEGIHRERLDEE